MNEFFKSSFNLTVSFLIQTLSILILINSNLYSQVNCCCGGVAKELNFPGLDFEFPPKPPNAWWITYRVGSSFGPWRVNKGGIDHVDKNYLNTGMGNPNGSSNFVDLYGSTPPGAGGITYPLTGLNVGDHYTIQFYYSRFDADGTFKINILVENGAWLNERLTATNRGNISWLKASFEFIAQKDSTTMQFNDDGSSGCICGVLIDDIKIFECPKDTPIIDSCAFVVEKKCLPNGMIELRAIDSKSQTIIPGFRKRELFWDIKDGPAGRGYSLTNVNPILVSNHTQYCLVSKIYTWPKGKPHTIEFAEICESKSCDTLNLNCKGPCQDFSFILSSCMDDYDKAFDLNFQPSFCKSVCLNNCDYIVGLFDLNGELIDPSFYNIKWSTGETGAVSMQKGCFNYILTVEVRRGDCYWFGRYRPSCEHFNGFGGDDYMNQKFSSIEASEQYISRLLIEKQDFQIFDLYGCYLGKNEVVYLNLGPGLYFIRTQQGNKEVIRKIMVINRH